jgi:hypothetical protein
VLTSTFLYLIGPESSCDLGRVIYKLNLKNYIYNYSIYLLNLVGRSSGKFFRNRLVSGGSCRFKISSFGCTLRQHAFQPKLCSHYSTLKTSVKLRHHWTVTQIITSSLKVILQHTYDGNQNSHTGFSFPTVTNSRLDATWITFEGDFIQLVGSSETANCYLSAVKLDTNSKTSVLFRTQTSRCFTSLSQNKEQYMPGAILQRKSANAEKKTLKYKSILFLYSNWFENLCQCKWKSVPAMSETDRKKKNTEPWKCGQQWSVFLITAVNVQIPDKFNCN